MRPAFAVVALLATLAASGNASAPLTPDFSGHWRILLTVRPTTGGPTTAAFGGSLTPPLQLAPAPLTSTGSRPASGAVSFQCVIGTGGKLVDIEPIVATVWSGFLPDLVTTMMESQRRQQFRAARLNGEAVPTILNSLSQTSEKPEGVTSQNMPLTHDVTIEQTAAALTSRRGTPIGIDIVVYPLDGTTGKTRLAMAAPDIEWAHTSRWEGEKLVTTTVVPAGQTSERRTETRYLQDGSMIVETAWTLREGVPPILKRLVYSKVGG